MKLKKDYILHTTGGEHMMVASGKAVRDFNGLVRSNDTANFLLEQLKKDQTEDQLVQALLDCYEVDPETARKDVRALVQKLLDEGFLDV